MSMHDEMKILANWISTYKESSISETKKNIEMINICLKKYPELSCLFRPVESFTSEELKKYCFNISFNPDLKFEFLLNLDNSFKTCNLGYAGLFVNVHNKYILGSFIDYLKANNLYDRYVKSVSKPTDPLVREINDYFIRPLKKRIPVYGSMLFSYYEDNIYRTGEDTYVKIKFNMKKIKQIQNVYFHLILHNSF